ncbi:MULTISPECIES: outer membrane beta-barrel protein [unclassified Halobacteriovorax]|uniref:outer membrane beta-barrel protein n=1 Tax=unclassified Halobacteriovorax TaxID=2639665 RepID=UPI000EA14235|nr:outer membrane beta-barrel protein [Halobacteriovorax sp. BALOs_7]AYF46011.1 outer membrane protein beta-barrel domain protein [Halobacteriovorax sp. BALOs_7]
MKRLLIAMMIMVAGFQANAGIYVEPYLAYNFAGDFEGTDTDGINIGGRLGYSLPMLVSFGLDYNMGTYDANGDDADVSNMGLFVAVDLPILARAYASYYLNSELESGAFEYEGSGMALGVGLTMLPFVSINFEYRKINYDDLNGSTVDLDSDEILLGVSVPLDL